MIVTVGEILVEFVSHRIGCGLETVGEYSGPYPSGAPAIFINQAARLGANTKLFGAVGKDAFGRSVLTRLSNDGVDISSIAQFNDKTTGSAFVSYYPDGKRVFVFNINGSAAEHIGQLDTFTTPFNLHVSGASLGFPEFREATVTLCNQAKKIGGTVTCDPNVRAELIQNKSATKALQHCIDNADIFLPSVDDLYYLYPGESLDKSLQRLLDSGIKAIVLKMGDQGIRVVTAHRNIIFPPHSIKELDPTGAGDCFCGAFTAMIEHGEDLVTAAAYANAAGALHVSERGPMEKNPNRTEIENFLAKEKENGYQGPTITES